MSSLLVWLIVQLKSDPGRVKNKENMKIGGTSSVKKEKTKEKKIKMIINKMKIVPFKVYNTDVTKVNIMSLMVYTY